MNPWILLFIAGLLEIVWALGFKYVGQGSPWWHYSLVYSSMGASFFLLIQALKVLPAGTAYAVWTGTGAVGVAIIGILFFNEPSSIIRIACIALIVAGIVGLKLSA